jgi:translation initiation factor 2B subunit (eIF-2B alpha/beta/delta family)/8-oxo-dGTP pyrophosphatase MutT (NUDIX family)
MRLRHVVTCFLVDPASGRVLLGRRSDRVSTYPGRWAAISGSVEDATPLAQARREIAEETGLRPEHLRLVAEGVPLRFAAWELGTVWAVHPFLFHCLRPEAARPDWEHVQFEWVETADIASLQTVPRLAEALAAVRGFEGRPSPDRVFAEVRGDRDRGADALGLLVLEAIRAAAPAEGRTTGEEWLQRMQEVCREAAGLRPSMASVRSAALEAFGACRKALEDSPGDPARTAAGAIDGIIAERERASLEAAAASAAMIEPGARVTTLSFSSTVLMALRDAAERVAELVVAESRPRCEGRETARLAASFGIPTRLVTDAAAAEAVAGTDLVLFGADSVTGRGDVANKTGTLALCLAARHFGVRTLCVSTPSKVLPEGWEPAREQMDPAELGEQIEGVEAENPYFETVPADLIDVLTIGPGIAGARLEERSRLLASLQRHLAVGAPIVLE